MKAKFNLFNMAINQKKKKNHLKTKSFNQPQKIFDNRLNTIIPQIENYNQKLKATRGENNISLSN